MTKDVLLSIRGMQFMLEDEEDEIETINRAQFFCKPQARYLIYEEVSEGFQEKTRNRIKFTDKEVLLSRKGLINVEMDFEENKKNLTIYHTPFGELMIGIDTESIVINETEDEISIDIHYALEVNYEHMADADLQIRIQAIKEESVSVE